MPFVNNDIADIEPNFNVVYDTCAGTSCVDITYNVPDQSMITYVEWYNSDFSQYDTTRNFCTNGGSQSIEVYTTTRYYCQVSDMEINLPSMLSATASATPSSCGNDGSVTCIPTGGTIPYTFTWNNGATTATVNNLPAGSYTVTIEDANGCTVSASTVIGSAQLMLNNVVSTPATCATAPDGGAYISVSSATPPVNYVWSNGAVTSTISNVLPGNYTVTATDGNGCSMVQTLVVGQTGLTAQTTQQVALSCLGTGAILQVSALNGYAPYTYQWSNGSTADTAANLIEDNYRVTVTDNYGCTVATGKGTTFTPGCVASLSGRVYAESDLSCAFDNLDVGLSNKVVVIEPGYMALTDSQGFWHVDVLLNPTYKVYVSHAGTAAFSICNIDTVVVPAPTSILVSNIDFPKSSSIINNVSVRMGCNTPRPGFSLISPVIINNYGLDTASGGGTVTLDAVIDSIRFLNIGSGITIDIISSTVPRIVYYSYTNLLPQQTNRFEVVSLIPTLPNVSLGQILNIAVTVNMGNAIDQLPSNNIYNCSMEIRGAFDPNDKQVFSMVTGESIDGPTSVGDSVLRYLIRFQNTGTDTAFNVLIKDTLHANLNIHTFQLLATSHPVEIEFKKDSIIHFEFNNILLPDSNVNEPASHGFAEFTIEVTDPNQLEELTNQASIFFDFNPPIYTNTVATQRNYYPCLYPASTYETVTSQTICHGDSYWGYSSTGTYRDTFVLSVGCDSVRVLNLTVLLPNVVSYSQTICAGQQFEGYSTNGTYYDTLTAANGCDSVRVLNLTVNNAPVTVLNETVCFGGSYLGYNANGTYYDTLSATTGCDSVRQLNLTVLPQNTSSITQSICAGQQFEGYSSTGIYTDTLTDVNGCDSVRVLDLTVGNSIVTVLNETVCFGDSYLGYNANGTYYDTLTAALGCDSMRQLNLTVLPMVATSVSASICDGESIFVGGADQTTSGTYTDTLVAASGCDSLVATLLSVNALPTEPQITQSGNTLSVDATGLAGFQWYLDGTALPGETTSELTPQANGNYQVVVFDGNNCSSTSGNFQVTGVSIDEIKQLPVSIFPNPTTGKLKVNVGGGQVEKIELYNALGQQLNVTVSNVGTSQVDVDASEFASGVYMVRILLSSGTWHQERVEIAR